MKSASEYDRLLKKEREGDLRKAKARISDFCVRSDMLDSAGKSFWKTAFFMLISSLLSVFGIIQLLTPLIIDIYQLSPMFFTVFAVSFAGIAVVIMYVGVHWKFFKTTHLFMMYFLIVLASATGLVGLVVEMLPFEGIEILSYFIVLLLTHVASIIFSFYITRRLICHVDEEKITPRNTSAGDF